MDTIQNFAGTDTDTAVVEPAAVAALTDYESRVTHYTVTAELGSAAPAP